ncbi:MAG: hypothetical protein ABJA98_14710 [Acidobacteriota bacterium]
MVTRVYSIGMRRFAITLTNAAAPSSSAWTIECVKDMSAGGREVVVLGMDQIAASAEEMAFARACDHIDKWLLSTR